MKKSILLIICCLLLIGCNKQTENIVEPITEEPESLITLSTNDKRLVYLDGDKYQVFEYDNDTITSFKVYLNYNTIDSAKNTLDIIKVNYANDKDVKEVKREGQFIVIVYQEEYVKKHYTNIDELKKTLSNLKEVN